MADRVEERLRLALDRLTENPPLPNRERPRPSRPTRHLPPVLAVAAAVALGLIALSRLAGPDDDALRQETGQVPPPADAEPAPAPPPPPGPRAAYPDVPTVAEAPVARASAAFGYGREGHWTWFVIDAASGSVRAAAEVRSGGWPEFGGAALSPDGRRLAYAIPHDARGDATSQVVVVDLTNGRETRFIANALLGPGAWAPDGGGLAWLDLDREALVLAGADGRPLNTVNVGAGRESLAWAPDGRRLVAAGCPTDMAACPPTVVEAATLAARSVPQSMTARTVWSPDSRELVDLARRDVAFVAPEGTGVRLLAPSQLLYMVDHPFSPDGKRAITRPDSSGRGAPYATVISLADGRMQAQLSDGQQVPEVVGWKGDGALLVGREEPGEIVFYAMPLDGSARRRLFSIAIRSEDFGASRVMVADWYTR